MKKLNAIIVLTILTASAMSCNVSKKPTTVTIEDENDIVVTYQTMDYNYPLADTIAKYAMQGDSRQILEKKMTAYAEELRPNMRDNGSVMQFNEGIIVAMDQGDVFKSADATLTESGKQQLQKLAYNLNKMPDTYVLVVGRTDNTGSKEMNEKLAYKRAAFAANYLRGCGIDQKRLFIDSYGENFPDYENKTASQRAKNRRVDFMIIPSNEMRQQALKNL